MFALGKSVSGSTSLMVTLAAPAVMGAVGVAADFAMFTAKQSGLQSASDAAALAGAKELSAAGTTSKTIESSVASFVKANESATVQVTTKVDAQQSSVTVQLVENWTPFFAHFLGAHITPVVAHATAKLVGQQNICVLALDEGTSGSLAMDNKSLLTANDCGVYVNSKSATAITLKNRSVIRASTTCSAGGVSNKGTISPAAITDCPAVEDPLGSRSGPAFGGCDYQSFTVQSGSVVLQPGVYCGGLFVKGNANALVQAGTFVIKDGPLSVSGTASFIGKDAGFFLTGHNALIDFSGKATISLEGPSSGDLAGLLIYADRNASSVQKHIIRSTNAHTLTGTIYLPRGDLRIDPGAKVAQNSAYTAIIANRVEVDMGPELVLNSNYGATSVPVPDGIRASADVVLAD
jgi:Flp pilus assembly protein TadG